MKCCRAAYEVGEAAITRFGEVKFAYPVGATIGRPCRDDNFRQGKTLRAAALAVPLFRSRPQTGGVCPSGGVFFPFVSERKGNQKEREFKGCALKNPLIVQI